MADSDYNIKKLRSGELTPDMLADLTEHVLRAAGFHIPDDLNDRLDASKTQAGALNGLIQAFQAVEGLTADGLAGAGTLRQIRKVQGVDSDEEGCPVAPESPVPTMKAANPDRTWDYFLPTDESLKGTASYGLEYPVRSKDVERIFGTPGKEKSPWFKENIIVCRTDKGDRPSLPGVSENRWVMVHKLVEPFFREAMRRATEACPEYFEHFDGTVRFGAYNYRHMRHDPKAPLSKHAWGICCDIEPQWNRGIFFKKGECPSPWTEAWWKKYPKGLPKAIADAFYSCGFIWGGDWDADGVGEDQKFSDPMHFQWYGSKEYSEAAAAR